ncbi:CrcB family protein [Saccharopolyspora cebuensis]|uniref:Fluoride-specific ion channel FluC n=1 Tax=Saccharopolyspora cebuensis TaxID=418759 RepID=A0ABV4CNV4_9PSEU
MLGVVALGGALGAVLRHGISVLLPHRGFPWATLLTNVAGCLAIGVLMYVITELVQAHRLVRPFVGIGVLGGFTTLSTYVVEGLGLAERAPALAALYLVGSVFACLGAVLLGLLGSRSVAESLRRR